MLKFKFSQIFYYDARMFNIHTISVFSNCLFYVVAILYEIRVPTILRNRTEQNTCSVNTYFTERHSWVAQQFISTIFHFSDRLYMHDKSHAVAS